MKQAVSSPPRVAVIGAGMAGLACARALSEHGLAPVVLEKSRGLGGRMASRRVQGQALDHGAQFFTAREPAFVDAVAGLRSSGAVAPWSPRQRQPHGAVGWHVGTPSMSRSLRGWARGLEVRTRTRIDAIELDDRGCRVRHAEGSEAFDVVACTAPAPQARALCAGHAELEQALAPVQMAPCWALMVRFEAPLDTTVDALRPGHAVLDWACRHGSRPQRGEHPEAWVVHASSAWSQAHLEDAPESVAVRLLEALAEVLDQPLPGLLDAHAHRWRHAMVTAPLGRASLASDDGRLVLGGDWCLGPRVECAFLSGQDMAATIVRRWLA